MGWFFGCFGGSKKERKVGIPPAGPSHNKHKKPEHFASQPVPGRLHTSASLPLKVPVREGPSREDLFRVRQVPSGSSGSAGNDSLDSPLPRVQGLISKPVNTPEGNIHPVDITPEKKKLSVDKPSSDPWSQVDELEEELEQLRKQLVQESDDAKKLRDEVKFLKSCGTLQQTPSEIRKRTQHPDRENTPEKAQASWHSWLLPPASPIAKTQLNKKLENEVSHVSSCEPTPAKECHDLLHGVQTPIFKGLQKRTLNDLELSRQASFQASPKDGNSGIQHPEKGKCVDGLHEFRDESKSTQPQAGEYPWEIVQPKDHVSLLGSKANASPDSQELFEIPPDLLRRSDLSSFREAEPMSSSEVHHQVKVAAGATSASNLSKQTGNQSSTDGIPQLKGSFLSSRSLSSDSMVLKVAMNDGTSNFTKKKRLRSPTSHEKSPKSLVLPPVLKAGVGEGEDTNSTSFTQKRLKTLPAASPVGAPSCSNESETTARPVGLHGIHVSKCETLSPILESGLSLEESPSCCSDSSCLDTERTNTNTEWSYRSDLTRTAHVSHEVRGMQFALRQTYETNYTSSAASESVSNNQSNSIASGNSTQGPASQSKSVSFASTGYGKVTTDEVSSDRSFCNSCSYEESIESGSENSASPSGSSMGNEESVSELAPVHCFSPPMTPRQHQRYVNGLDGNSSDGESTSTAAAEEEAAKHGNRSAHVLGRYATSGVRKQISRHDYEGVDNTEDDYDLFSDAVSHVSTECSEKDNGRHGRTDSMDSLTMSFAQLGTFSDAGSFSQKTPLKLCGSFSTPGTIEKTLAGRNSRLRSKPASSVLIPVENLSQWKQLKGSAEASPFKKSSDLEGLNKAEAKALSKGRQKVVKGALTLNNGDWDENQCALPDASKSDTFLEDATTSGTSDFIRVDTSLSHWLKPSSPRERVQHHASRITKGTTSRQGQNESLSSAPQSQIETPPALMQGQRSPARIADERPILGAVAGELSTLRKWWDGKGIPNSTTKYKEDQKVNWHTTPFEVRLERALDKQGLVLQKKLFGGAAAVPVDSRDQ